MRGLYRHIPFCLSKCEYCDFNSYPGKLDMAEEYVSALLKEASEFSGQKVDTVYIGGGTPTALPCETLVRLIQGIKSLFLLADGCEFTVEMNPRTADAGYLKTIKALGVNRISLGAQSFDDKLLKTLGRRHNSQDIRLAVKMCRDAGFENISLDLMFSLPEQNLPLWKQTLEEAVALKPMHISCYGLKIEEGTPFYEKGVMPAEEELDREMYHYAVGFFEKNGFLQYEISNFAKPEKESRHNLKYWHCQEYFGLGAGAHSYVNGVRAENVRPVEQYIKLINETGDAREDSFSLTERDLLTEKIIMGLRLKEGISESYVKNAEKYISAGFMEKAEGNIRFTLKGFDVSNSILADLI